MRCSNGGRPRIEMPPSTGSPSIAELIDRRERPVELAEQDGKGDSTANSREQDAGHQQKPVWRDRQPRRLGRIDDLQLDLVCLGIGGLGKVGGLQAIEQFLVVLAQHTVIAVHVLVLGHQARLLALHLFQPIQEFSLGGTLALQGGDGGIGLHQPYLELLIDRVGHRALAGRLPRRRPCRGRRLPARRLPAIASAPRSASSARSRRDAVRCP